MTAGRETQSARVPAREVVSRRPVCAEIDLSAVEHNARTIKRLIGQDCRLFAVVKANGYGLGAEWIGRAALRGGADRLAVACVDEGVQLRLAGLACPILVMGYAAPEEMRAAVQYDLTLALHRVESLRELSKTVDMLRPGETAPVHIKVDTGFGRYGCTPEEFGALAREVSADTHVRFEAIMTHFVQADSPDPAPTRAQLARLAEVEATARALGATYEFVHAANSPATLALPEARLGGVRVGIMLSGHSPTRHLDGVLPLRKAFTLSSRIARLFAVAEGEGVGYGHTWRADRPSTVALVPAGYADGYVRLLSNRGAVIVGGRRCPVAGRVSMDQIAVDVTDVSGVAEGDEVVLIGRQGDAEVTTDEVAAWAETISYEVLTGLAPRVPRRYLRDGRVVGECDLLGCSYYEAYPEKEPA